MAHTRIRIIAYAIALLIASMGVPISYNALCAPMIPCPVLEERVPFYQLPALIDEATFVAIRYQALLFQVGAALLAAEGILWAMRRRRGI